MAAERYLSRRIPDLRVGNNIDEIDKKLIPASIHPCIATDLGLCCSPMSHKRDAKPVQISQRYISRDVVTYK